MEQLPIQRWSEYYYASEPNDNPLNRGCTLQFIIICITLLLIIYLGVLSQQLKSDPTRTFGLIQMIPIAFNMVPRILRAIVLGSTVSADYKWLGVLTTLEYTLHLIFYLSFLGSLPVYSVLLWRSIVAPNQRSYCLCYIPIILLSAIFGIIHYNFSNNLTHISLVLYFTYIMTSTIAAFSIVTLMIPISVFRKNTKYKEDGELPVVSCNDLMWLYPFICLATVPTVYLTVMSAFDFVYAMHPFDETPSSFYISLATIRPFILTLNPLIVTCAILLILPSYRNRLFFNGKWNRCSQVSPSSPVVEINEQDNPKPCMQMETLEVTPSYRSAIQQVVPGHLEELNQYLYPGATPIDPGKTVIAGGFSRLDPDIYPGAASVVPVALFPIPTTAESSKKSKKKVVIAPILDTSDH